MADGGKASMRALCDGIRRWARRCAARAGQLGRPGKAVAVVGFFSDEEERVRLQRTFEGFNYAKKRLYLYPAEREGELYDVSNDVDEALVACIHPDYDYPPSYLAGMLAACDDSEADVVWTSEPDYPLGTFADIANPDIYASIVPAHVLRLFYSRSNRHIRPENLGARSQGVRTFNCVLGGADKHAFPNPLRTKNAIYGLVDYAFRMDRRCIQRYLELKNLNRVHLDIDYDEFLDSLSPIQRRHLLYFLNTNRAGERAYDYVSQYLQLDANQAVLDIGSGYGGLLKAFARRGHPSTGVEILQSLIDLAKVNLAGYDAKLILGDFLADELMLAGYELLTMTDVIEHVADVDKAIAKTVGILNPGGHAYVKVPNYKFLDYVREDSHTGLFGITLLSHDKASAYLAGARGIAYSVGEYYDYDYYIRTFEKYGATLANVDNIHRPVADAPQLIAACETALEKWEHGIELPATTKSHLRVRAQEYITEVKRRYELGPDEVFVRDYMTSHWNMFFRKRGLAAAPAS